MNPTQAVAEAAKIVGGQTELARILNVKPPTVNQWAAGVRPVPPKRAAQIEAATRGAVSKANLCPDFPWDIATSAA